MRNSLQKGFTLIELIVVIVILGILASFAVPRFMGVEREARVAAVNSMAGTLRSAAAMAHGVSMAQGLAPATAITVEGNPIAMVSAYPNRTAIGNLVQDTTGFTPNGTGRFTRDGSVNASCFAQYNNATTQNVVVNGANQVQTVAPVVTTTITGC
jgi:MSHA pilin protein MshA